MNYRPLKFRVWDKNHNKFLVNGIYSTSSRVGDSGDVFISLDGNLHVAIYPCGNGDNSADSIFSPIGNANDFIIQQFTGLHDKTGKEIYEGDIVSHGDSYPTWVIEYNDRIAAFTASGLLINTNVGRCVETNSLIIIGNVFENSELLK